MSVSWRLILLLVPLIAGAIGIFFTFRLNKRYRIPFVNSYFFYLVFLYIFGSYSLAGSGIMEFLLTRMEVDPDVIRSSRLYAIFLGIPFAGLSHFMFLRSIREFFRRKQSILFIILFFSVIISAFILYGVYMVKYSLESLPESLNMISLQQMVFCGFIFLVYAWGFLSVLFWSAKQAPIEKRYIRTFGASYMIFMVLCVCLVIMQRWLPFAQYIFIFVFLSLHLIPILFLNLYLDKIPRAEPDSETDFEKNLVEFAARHEISKRECEVVRLICQGYSNQEISEALYISLQTVKDHTHRIFVKTGVRNRVQLTNMIR